VKRALILVLGAFVVYAWWLNCVAEDAYITYRFARNVAEGHGFVWNVGEAPVEGFTNFLWLLLSVGAYRLGLDLPRVTQGLGLLAGVITLVYAWRFSTEILRHRPGFALLTTTLLAACGPLATWATSGLETVPFTLAVTMAVFYASRLPSRRSSRNTVIAAGCLLLATLTRPEGFGIFLIVAAAQGVLGRWQSHRSRDAVLLGAIYVPLFLLYFVWRYHTFGYLLPNTFYAKTGGGLAQVRHGVIYIGYFALHFVMPCVPWAVLAAWRFTGDRDGRMDPESLAPDAVEERRRGLVIAASVIVGYLGYVALVGGDYMAMYRFLVPVLPLGVSMFGELVELAVPDAPLPRSRRLILGLLSIGSIGGVLLQSSPYEAAVFKSTPRMHGTYRGVRVERWHVNRFHVIGEFFNRQTRTADDSVLTWDIGVVGYITRLKIYDALGIVDPVIAHAGIDAGLKNGLPGHERQDLEYSYSRHPTFVMYTMQLRPQPATWPVYPAELTRRVQSEYELKSVWLSDVRNGEQGYFSYLERKR
jgi:arabinofuranosyltransferase